MLDSAHWVTAFPGFQQVVSHHLVSFLALLVTFKNGFYLAFSIVFSGRCGLNYPKQMLWCFLPDPFENTRWVTVTLRILCLFPMSCVLTCSSEERSHFPNIILQFSLACLSLEGIFLFRVELSRYKSILFYTLQDEHPNSLRNLKLFLSRLERTKYMVVTHSTSTTLSKEILLTPTSSLFNSSPLILSKKIDEWLKAAKRVFRNSP